MREKLGDGERVRERMGLNWSQMRIKKRLQVAFVAKLARINAVIPFSHDGFVILAKRMTLRYTHSQSIYEYESMC